MYTFVSLGQEESIQHNLSVIVDHAFGNHKGCNEKWCKCVKDPDSYEYKDLPGKKPLSDDNLRAVIEDALVLSLQIVAPPKQMNLSMELWQQRHRRLGIMEGLRASVTAYRQVSLNLMKGIATCQR